MDHFDTARLQQADTKSSELAPLEKSTLVFEMVHHLLGDE